jgi:two-component system, cell cycle response regulator DivK
MSQPSDRPLVLVVDDDRDTQDLYAFMLDGAGYRVESASTVRRVDEVLDQVTPAVVISDWRLPDGDGLAVAAALRAPARTRHVPLVAVTGVTMSAELRARALAAGFGTVITKPASPDEIVAAVDAACESATAARLRAAVERLRRYAVVAARHAPAREPRALIDTRTLLERAAARTGGHIALMVADDGANYVGIGGSAKELTGYEPRELLALTVWDLTPLPDASAGRELWQAFIASGSQQGRYRLRRRDGLGVEAQYYAEANVLPGLHVSALAGLPAPPSRG